MGSATLEVLPAAEEEALEAAQWYRERSAKAAQAFQSEIRAAFARIQQTPETWPREAPRKAMNLTNGRLVRTGNVGLLY